MNRIDKGFREYVQEGVTKKEITAKIFFLPIETRPVTYKKLPLSFRGKFWHTGIIYANQVFETFSGGRFSIKTTKERLPQIKLMNAVYINATININKLNTELFSGVDCAEYVARVTGLSHLKGSNKGKLYPEDVYNKLINKK